MNINISDKQRGYIEDSNSDINIATGPIRCGKTYSQRLKLQLFSQSEECLPRVHGLITGKTGETVERNVINDFLIMVDELGTGKDWEYRKAPRRLIYKPKQVVYWVIGANDEGSESRLRGSTLQSWFADEASLHNKSFFYQAIGRCSAGSRRKWLTTNPDSPDHWLLTDFIQEGGIDCRTWWFKLTDNPILDPQYIRNLYQMYGKQKLYMQRYLEGKWVADIDAMVIPEFLEAEDEVVITKDNQCVPEHFIPVVAMDVGYQAKTFVIFGFYDFLRGKAVIQANLVFHQCGSKEISDGIKEVESNLWPGLEDKVRRWSDNDLILIHDLTKLHNLRFLPTLKDNRDAQVNFTRHKVGERQLEVWEQAQELIVQMRTGCWNERRTDFETDADMGHLDGIAALLYFMRNLPYNHNPYPKKKYSQKTHFVRPSRERSHHELEKAFLR